MFFFFQRGRYDYDLLSTSTDDTPSVEEKTDWTLFFPALFCGVTAIISVIILHLGPTVSSTSNLSLYELQSARNDLANLRRPSQYMGLEKVNRTSSSAQELSVMNFPFVVGRLDEGNPHNILTNGPESHTVANGLESRRIQISSTISTVIQFRTIDWMLEACTLRIRLPGIGDKGATHLSFGAEQKHMEVHRVNCGAVLDVPSLALHSLPQERENLAVLQLGVADGLEWAYHFNCAMDTLHTFLLTAGDNHTELDWWQNKQFEVPSVHIVQEIA